MLFLENAAEEDVPFAYTASDSSFTLEKETTGWVRLGERMSKESEKWITLGDMGRDNILGFNFSWGFSIVFLPDLVAACTGAINAINLAFLPNKSYFHLLVKERCS